MQNSTVLIIAIIGDILTAFVKLVVSMIGGSQVLLTEGLHSLADVINQLLLAAGLRSDTTNTDGNHPFGKGQSKFYWSFLISVCVLVISGTICLITGLEQIINPHPVREYGLGYLVLLSSLSLQVVSLALSSGFFAKANDVQKDNGHKPGVQLDLTTTTIYQEDIYAIIGIVIALISLALTQYYANPVYDGLGGMLIGLLLFGVGFLQAKRMQDVLISETVSPAVYQQIIQLLRSFDKVDKVLKIDTFYAGENKAILKLQLGFDPDLNEQDQKAEAEKIKQRICEEIPCVSQLFIC